MAKAVTQRVKKKEKKNITAGVAHVNSTFNNIGDGTERDGLRDGQPAVCKQCDHDQRDIDQERRGQRL